MPPFDLGIYDLPFNNGQPYLPPCQTFPEGSTPVFTGTIQSGPRNNPVVIPGSQLTTLTLTILDKQTQIIINDVDNIDILNTNRGTVDNNGLVTITLESGDTSLSEQQYTVPRVERSLLIEWTYNSGTAVGIFTYNFWVEAVPEL